eukprot:9475373-Pyramimonas_sp.AAC.2
MEATSQPQRKVDSIAEVEKERAMYSLGKYPRRGRARRRKLRLAQKSTYDPPTLTALKEEILNMEATARTLGVPTPPSSDDEGRCV